MRLRRGDYVLAVRGSGGMHTSAHVRPGGCRLLRVVAATRQGRARLAVDPALYGQHAPTERACAVVCLGSGVASAQWQRQAGSVEVLMVGPLAREPAETEWSSLDEARAAIRAAL